jgi:hypothetical protein
LQFFAIFLQFFAIFLSASIFSPDLFTSGLFLGLK